MRTRARLKKTLIFTLLAVFTSVIALFTYKFASFDQEKFLKPYLSKMGFRSISYEDVEYKLDQINIKNLRSEGRVSLSSPKVSIHLGIDPTKPYFISARNIVIDSPLINIKESSKKTSHGNPSQTRTHRIYGLIDKLLRSDINISTRNAKLSLGINKKDTLSLHFDLDFHPDRDDFEFVLQKMKLKNRYFLKNIRGKLILDKKDNAYPFLISNQNKGRHNWQAKGHIKDDFQSLEIYLKNSGIPNELQRYFKGFVYNLDNVNYAMKLKIKIEKDILFTYYAGSTNLEIYNTKIHSKPFGPIPFKTKVEGRLNLHQRNINIDHGVLKIFNIENRNQETTISYQVSNKEMLAPNSLTDIEINLPRTRCRTIIESIPNSLFKYLDKFESKGTLKAKLKLSFRKDKPEDYNLKIPIFENHCQIESNSNLFSKKYLLDGEFINDLNGQLLSPQQYAFLYRNFMHYGKSLADAVVVNEDANFWNHPGVNYMAFSNAIRANLKHRFFKFGASTITMQLVKNLYFSHEKTISRKLEEIILSQYIEKILSKNEILEIYLNIIEFGPDIFGVSDASRIFFDKKSSNLTLSESAYLASILTNPKLYIHNYCQKRLDAKTSRKVRTTLHRLHGSGLISSEDLIRASEGKVSFASSPQYESENCPQVYSGGFMEKAQKRF